MIIWQDYLSIVVIFYGSFLKDSCFFRVFTLDNLNENKLHWLYNLCQFYTSSPYSTNDRTKKSTHEIFLTYPIRLSFIRSTWFIANLLVHLVIDELTYQINSSHVKNILKHHHSTLIWRAIHQTIITFEIEFRMN